MMNWFHFKKRKILIAAFLLLINQIQAQKKLAVTADSAVAIAFNNVAELKNLQIDSLLQWQKNREITGMAFPQINGSISMQHFYNIPVTVLPDFISPAVYGTLVKEGVKDRNGNPIQMPTQFATFPASFGVPNSASAGFSVQQLLFQPDVFVGLQARSTSMKLASSNIKMMKDSIKSNVYRNYFTVVVAEKRLQFLRTNIKTLEKLFADQEVMFKNGFIEKLDLDKTQVSLNNLKATEKSVENLVQLGYAGLKFILGLNQKDELQLKDTLSADVLKKDVLNFSGFKYEDRNEIEMLNNVKTLQQLDLKRNKLQYIPTVAAYWNFSKNAQRQKFDFFNKGDWFTTNLVGLNVSIPIWNGGQREAKIKQSLLNLEKTTNTINRLQQAIDLQQDAAKVTLTNALTSLDIQERNVALAEKVFNLTRKKYEQGLGSSFEVLQSEASLHEAQNNYVVSLYDAMIAKIGLLKAIGKL